MQEVIVKYNGDITSVGYAAEILNENYAILTLPEEEIPRLQSFTQIEYTELPKLLSLSQLEAADYSCVSAAQSESGYGLTGRGVLTAFIDSGIDYGHEAFTKPDGTSRIISIWDQTLNGKPPDGFLYGTEFTADEINAALTNGGAYVKPSVLADDIAAALPHRDDAGHGTAVAGIAAGKHGVAPKASIIAVKLGERDGFARTTEIMRGIKYVYDKAEQLNMPLAVNISYGTNDGAHDGSSLFESYVDSMAETWKSVIAAASGNEGAAGHHFSYKLTQGETVGVNFTVGTNLKTLTLALWKNFADSFSCEVTSPGGSTTGKLTHTGIPIAAHLDGTQLRFKYSQPNPYNSGNEVIFLIENAYEIPQGTWTIKINGLEIVDGSFDIWLPTLDEVTEASAFLLPSPELTVTLPACARKVIAVGGYDTSTGGIAPFSGRGRGDIKPELCAPAVNVESAKAGGGYGRFTGTSMAAPFVTGSVALIMQWGIINGNDAFLYGQRVKAFLQRGAARDARLDYPNNIWGYGKLCVKKTMDYLEEYR